MPSSSASEDMVFNPIVVLVCLGGDGNCGCSWHQPHHVLVFLWSRGECCGSRTAVRLDACVSILNQPVKVRTLSKGTSMSSHLPSFVSATPDCLWLALVKVGTCGSLCFD